jgi:hypothetical protein
MAIDPRIALAGRGSNVSSSLFSDALQNIQQAPLRRAQLQAQESLVPVGVQQAEANANLATENASEAQQLNRVRSIAIGAAELLPAIQSGNREEVAARLTQRRAQLQQQGLPTNDTDEAIASLSLPNWQEVLGQDAQGAIDMGDRLGVFGRSGARDVAIRSSAPIVDPTTGQLSIPTFDPNTNTTKLIPLEGAVAETPSAKRESEARSKISVAKEEAELKRRSTAISAAVSKGSKIFDRIQPLGLAISNYDEAIAAIDAGAQTGVIDAFLPSFRKASIELDNIVKRLGLDVVGNTTFGALSESELKFALRAAIPDNLQPADLRVWLTQKRDAQKKVKERVEQAASFLSAGTNTIKDWIELDTARQLSSKNDRGSLTVAPEATPQTQTQAPGGTRSGRFSVVEVN